MVMKEGREDRQEQMRGCGMGGNGRHGKGKKHVVGSKGGGCRKCKEEEGKKRRMLEGKQRV